jgi:hypothetical protein
MPEKGHRGLRRLPLCAAGWQSAWFFAFPPEIRKVINTVSAVESLSAAFSDQQEGFANPPQGATLPHVRAISLSFAHPRLALTPQLRAGPQFENGR